MEEVYARRLSRHIATIYETSKRAGLLSDTKCYDVY
jgi:hypothetical protein